MNEFEQAEERRKRQREEIKQKRIRQLRRRMTISGCILLCIIIALAAFAVNVAKKKKLAAEQKKQLEQEIAQMNESLNDCYNTFLTDNGMSAEKSDVTAFTKWLEKNHSEEMDDLFLVYQKNKKITAQDIYDSFGATLHVLSDTYEGKLKDEATAAKNHIYEKKAAENGTVQITAAGDLCLEEDGYVLDYYDTVNDLSKCISKTILDQTNAADLFFLNHEYCVSDRGTPLEDKYYVFRAKPERMKLLEQMGTDIVSIANNHIYDYGADAMDDTIDLLDQAKINHVGGGTNLDEATLCTGKKKVQFAGIPTFSPEHFARIEQKDTMKRKQFVKGMEQIAQEGAIQIFREVGGGMEEVVVGVVGVLQLEVLEYRLNTEYNVEIRMQQLPFEQLRWVKNDPDTYNLRDLDLTSDTKAVEDMKGNRLLLFTSDWAVRWAETHNDTLELSEFGNI